MSSIEAANKQKGLLATLVLTLISLFSLSFGYGGTLNETFGARRPRSPFQMSPQMKQKKSRTHAAAEEIQEDGGITCSRF